MSAGHDGPPASGHWQPWPGRRWCYATGALVGLILGLRSEGGALGLGAGLAFTVATVVLAVLAASDVWYGVPLSFDPDGLVVRRGPGRRTVVPWSAVDRIEATTTTSRGLLRLASLEIDADEQLLVLSRHRLGADPGEVADELRRRWPHSP